MNSKSSRTGPAFESLEAAMIARPIGNHSNAQKTNRLERSKA